MVEVLVQVSPRQQTVVRVEEAQILAGGWRQAAKERAAVLMGWTIFDVERARIGLRPEDKRRLVELCRRETEGADSPIKGAMPRCGRNDVGAGGQ